MRAPTAVEYAATVSGRVHSSRSVIQGAATATRAALTVQLFDPAIDLAVVQGKALTLPGGSGQRYALKNAFGFGGHNISLVLAA